MPAISTIQFLQITDRLAATYELLLQDERSLTVPQNTSGYQSGQAYPGRLLLDLTGTGVHVLLEAKVRGTIGNTIFVTFKNPGINNASLSSLSLGTNLVISLATDASGNTSSTTEDVIRLLDSNTDFSTYLNVFYPVTGTGGLVQPWPMTALAGGTGSGALALPTWTIRTTRPGPEGNLYTLTINQPVTASAVFSTCWNQTDLVINLPTDGSSNPTETFTLLQTHLATVTPDFSITAVTPGDLVPAVAKTSFSGGGIGSYAQVVLTPPPTSRSDSADPDVAAALSTPSQSADTQITAYNICKGVDYIENLQQALTQHFLRVGYPGGMAGFMTDNNLLVHKSFSTINFNRQGQTLNAANVFRPDSVVMGTVTMGSGAVSFVSGVTLGTGSGAQSETNYGAASLIAVLVPSGGGNLLANWSFTVNILDSTGTARTSSTIVFTAGDAPGKAVSITSTASPDRHFMVNSAMFVSGGTSGDKVFITQKIERQITL